MEATLCFVIDGDRVLLIEKRRGLGEGLLNAPGGKVEAGERPQEAAVRETREEVGIEVLAPNHAGHLTFTLNGTVHTECHVFRTRSYEGTPRPTPEADPVWVDVESVPYDRMWDDDRYWLPPVLEGETVRGTFHFEGSDGVALDEATFVDHELTVGVDPDST